MAGTAQGFLCPKCKEKTEAIVVKDPLSDEKGGYCHLRGTQCRHIVVLKCNKCGTEHGVEAAWHRRW